MTNEDFVAAIQSGQRDLWTELWRQMQGLAWQQIHRWSWAEKTAGLEREDLLQVSMLALLMAVDSYDPGRGAQFSTWFMTALRREFTVAAGVRTEKQSQDPLRDAMSLDQPLTDNAGDPLVLADILENPDSDALFRQVELQASLEEALSALPEDQRRALYCRYWLEAPADPKAHDAALRSLRYPSMSRRLREVWRT